MKTRRNNKTLYLVTLTGLAILVFSSLGSGLWNQPADYSTWPYRLFYGICHQIPERSFHINSVPMAVNARCFGIFTGLLTTWITIPLIAEGVSGKTWPKKFLGVAVMVQILDYTVSWLDIWNGTNYFRFFVGLILGVAVVSVLADQFCKLKNNG